MFGEVLEADEEEGRWEEMAFGVLSGWSCSSEATSVTVQGIPEPTQRLDPEVRRAIWDSWEGGKGFLPTWPAGYTEDSSNLPCEHVEALSRGRRRSGQGRFDSNTPSHDQVIWQGDWRGAGVQGSEKARSPETYPFSHQVEGTVGGGSNMGTGRRLVAIPRGTKGILGDEGVSDLGGGGCHGSKTSMTCSQTSGRTKEDSSPLYLVFS